MSKLAEEIFDGLNDMAIEREKAKERGELISPIEAWKAEVVLMDEKLSGVRGAVEKIARAYGGRIQTKIFDPKADSDDFGSVIALMDETVITISDLASFAQLYESLRVD